MRVFACVCVFVCVCACSSLRVKPSHFNAVRFIAGVGGNTVQLALTCQHVRVLLMTMMMMMVVVVMMMMTTMMMMMMMTCGAGYCH